MRLYSPINDKPPSGMRRGLDVAIGLPYAEFAHRRLGSLVAYTDLSTYLSASAILDGETTRRTGLNLDRGGQPQDAQRVAGKREWHRETGKSSPQRMAPTVINSARSKLRRFSVSTVRIHQQSSGLNHREVSYG
jgi:hypothetical protein